MDPTTLLQIVAAYGTLILLVWALIDAARYAKADFGEVDKMPRWFWLTMFGFAIGLLLWLGAWRPEEPFGPRSITWLGELALAGLYFYDIRPKLRRAREQRELTSGS